MDGLPSSPLAMRAQGWDVLGETTPAKLATDHRDELSPELLVPVTNPADRHQLTTG
ncbi:MAG: hypothetical protein ACKOCM_01290 [Cyanobacteriota bacterium]